eukprot:scaffold945_cov170-Amphora_coffeaeformis.AAC.22
MDAADAAKALSEEPPRKKEEPPVAMAPPLLNAQPPSTAVRIAGHMLRTLTLDGPLLVVLLTFAAVSWCSHVTTTYLVPQYHDMRMTPERQATEMTYYVRECSATDLSTKNGMELFLPQNATPDDAYEHQLKHGFTVFRSVLQKDTAKNLRDYVSARNYNLTEQESIFVIENENRYSFGLGTDEPVVAKAMKELTTHPLLRASVEKILGPNPALIEMTAITSSYGAVHQHWHDDVVPFGSPVRHARAFGPSYSVFVQVCICVWVIIFVCGGVEKERKRAPLVASPSSCLHSFALQYGQLQDTTKEMGATGACPGTHYCSGGVEMDLCGEEGFQLVNENGVWATGDALLMNMNSFHRGSAHTDPNAPDRVMLILTWMPKPKEFAESRRMAQGITFSIRWDMWGHTWDDLAHATERMGQPWATLRSLALYKPRDAEWGMDYITSSSLRGVGLETGFDGEAMAKFQKWGQITWLPMFLQEKGLDPDEEDVWLKYCTRTLKKVHTFLGLVVFSAISGYAVICAVVSILQTKRSWAHSFGLSILRLGAICAAAYVVFVGLKSHVDSTRWAADIRGNRRYSSVFANDLAYGVKSEGLTTLPHRKDVLIENRFGSSYLHFYNDYVNGHPGNRYFLDLVNGVSAAFGSYPFWLQEATARYVTESVLANQGRFLEQGVNGDWYINDFEEAMVYTRKTLVQKTMPVVAAVLQELRFIVSGFRFSTLRNTKLAQKHMAPFLKSFEEKLVAQVLKEEPAGTSPNTSYVRPPDVEPLLGPDNVTVLKFKAPVTGTLAPALAVKHPLRTPHSNATWKRRGKPSKVVPSEPEPGAWFSTGSSVEAFFEGFWFIGEVTQVTAFGKYYVVFPDGDQSWFSREFVRPFEPYHVGEPLQVYQDGMMDYEHCEIVAAEDDGTYHAVLSRSDKYYDKVLPQYFRRYHFGDPIEERTYTGAY